MTNSAPTATPPPIKVFISYVNYDGSENYRGKILSLSNRLIADRIDCEIDQYHETNPPIKGWPLWMLDVIDEADFVLVVCTETYYRRFRGDELPGVGLGAVWEARNIAQQLYDKFGTSDKFIPVGFASHSAIAPFIPDPLRSTIYRDISTDAGYISLLRQLTNQPAIVKPALGTFRHLPPDP